MLSQRRYHCYWLARPWAAVGPSWNPLALTLSDIGEASSRSHPCSPPCYQNLAVQTQYKRKDGVCFLTHITISKGESSTSPSRRKVTTHPASAIREENLDQDMTFLDHCSTLKIYWRVCLTHSQSIKQGAGRRTQTGEHKEALRATSNGHAQQKSSRFLYALMM